MIERLAAASPPLIVSGRALTLTDTGRAVLAGEIDRVDALRHRSLARRRSPPGPLPTWRWNPDKQRIVQA